MKQDGATAPNNRCPAAFAALTTQYTARVASRVGHLERYAPESLKDDVIDSKR